MTYIVRAPQRFRLIVVLSCFLGGIAVGSLLAPSIDLVYYVSVATIALGLGFLFRQYTWQLVSLGMCLALAGYVWSALQVQQTTLTAEYDYEGLVRVESVRSARNAQERVVVQLLEGDWRGNKVRAYVYDWTYEIGTTLRVETHITPSQHASDLGYGLLGTAGNLEKVRKVEAPRGIATFHIYMQERVGATLPEPYASLAIGLVTGASDSFDQEFRDDLQRTGTSHVVAVSGYNLTIVALFLRRLGQRYRRWLGFLLAAGSMVMYVALAGATPSILRGAIVAGFSLVAVASGRVTHRVPLVLLGATVLAIIQPLGMLYNLSWQLSFLAFVGILFLQPVISSLLKWLGPWRKNLVETLSAEVMVLPLVLSRFGVFSLVSPVVNTVVLTIVPFAMLISTLHTLLALVAVDTGRLFAWVTYPVLWCVVRPIAWASELSFASYEVHKFLPSYLALSYVAIGIVFGAGMYVSIRRRRDATHTS